MNKTLHIQFQYDNPSFERRINYVLDFINNHTLAKDKISLDLEGLEPDLKINYGNSKEGSDFIIPAQNVFFNKLIPDFEKITANQYLFNDHILYSVENEARNGKAFLIDRSFQFDIIETIFFHISRFEEWHYLEGREDEHGRMDENQQFLVKNRLHRKPVVDHLVFCLLEALGIDIHNQKTQYRITHDIDFIFKRNDFWGVIKSIGGAILKRQDLKSAWRVWKKRHQVNPYDTFDWMLRKETGIEKVIYFLVGGDSKFDNSYDLNLSFFKKAILLSKERSYLIGIHPSYNSLNERALTENELKKLEETIGEEINITRQHFLRFGFKHTPQIIQQLGLIEDSSIGFADRIGFRCGTGFGYHLYDFENEKAFDFLEMPLIFMDSGLFHETNERPQSFQKNWDEFILSNQFNTKITFNFHNSRFYDADIRNIPLRKLYESLFSNKNTEESSLLNP